ncbi:hypothetical protein PR002_g18209 [Phytophthora rubi]|uniref:Uncharacterized protein n=1 Tax=Phytophthora rubi TaxID=129364 RepID=A0A6A3K906_9STRA|nr:hypothetical protein PR002_g18209 [Phytophthora rubi]
MEAARNEHTRVVDLLKLERANIDAAAKNGQTALHFAAATGYLATVKSLLRLDTTALCGCFSSTELALMKQREMGIQLCTWRFAMDISMPVEF